jgi:hypothetical protein
MVIRVTIGPVLPVPRRHCAEAPVGSGEGRRGGFREGPEAGHGPRAVCLEVPGLRQWSRRRRLSSALRRRPHASDKYWRD